MNDSLIQSGDTVKVSFTAKFLGSYTSSELGHCVLVQLADGKRVAVPREALSKASPEQALGGPETAPEPSTYAFVKKYAVPSFTDDSKEYTVTETQQGSTTVYACTCPAWTYRQHTCKHIYLVQQGSAEAPLVQSFSV